MKVNLDLKKIWRVLGAQNLNQFLIKVVTFFHRTFKQFLLNVQL